MLVMSGRAVGIDGYFHVDARCCRFRRSSKCFAEIFFSSITLCTSPWRACPCNPADRASAFIHSGQGLLPWQSQRIRAPQMQKKGLFFFIGLFDVVGKGVSIFSNRIIYGYKVEKIILFPIKRFFPRTCKTQVPTLHLGFSLRGHIFWLAEGWVYP